MKNGAFDFSEKVQAGFIVLVLPSKYEYLPRNLRAKNDNLTLSKLKSKLLEEKRRTGDSNEEKIRPRQRHMQRGVVNFLNGNHNGVQMRRNPIENSNHMKI